MRIPAVTRTPAVRRRSGGAALPPQESTGASRQALTLRAAALALGYPDDELLARLPLLESATPALGPAADPMRRFLAYLQTTPPATLQEHYVETFDLRRRCCLYLTYYAFGDTRKRGMALLRFTHAYRGAGEEFLGEELPDHLAVVCEFAAAHPQDGLRLIAEHRAGVELLHAALLDVGSPYADVLAAIRSVLPEPTPRDLDRARTLALAGPPEEEVGLEPFSPPEMPGGRR